VNDPFINATVRTADDLLADLEACRQLRHVSKAEKHSIVNFFFGDIQHPLREGKKLPGTNRFFMWTWEAFCEAFFIHGYACDTCDAVVEVGERDWRRGADRALQNLDGEVKLMLCHICRSRFSNFCQRKFDRDVRVPYSRDLEQMMIAFVASEVGALARRVMAGRNPRRRKDECPATGDGSRDRAPIAPRVDASGDLSLDWRQSEHGRKVPEGIRQ
jgi:hypothetical protein